MNLDSMIQEKRKKDNAEISSLQSAKDKMKETDRRLGKLWKDQELSEELLNKVISL